MKKLLLLFLTLPFLAKAQNYQCLQAGVKHFFINSNGYLRGIRIDSVRTVGDTTVYYPFHTPRGAYNTVMATGNPVLDSNGGSWLGGKVLQLNDGTFIFDSYWNDSVIIKTQANVGDSWLFYSDSSSVFYRATIIAKDTMTVLSSLDSEKTILITACDSSGILPSDPLESFTIMLSKNHGFVQVFDLYTFPYHKVDSVYRQGLDFYLDRSTCTEGYINGNSGVTVITPGIAYFKLTDFIIPNDQELHNWSVGEIFQSHLVQGMPMYGPFCYDEYITDTVVGTSTVGHVKSFILKGTPEICYSCTWGLTPCPSINDTGTFSFSDLNYSIADTSFIPEHTLRSPWDDGSYIFYFPDDTQFCLHSPFYRLFPKVYFTGGLGGVYTQIDYKLGIGEIFYVYEDGNPTYGSITLTHASAVGCGTLVEVKQAEQEADEIQLLPNPAAATLTIMSGKKMSFVSVSNLLGQTIYSSQCDATKMQLDVSNWPAGIYFAKVDGVTVKKFIKN